jgi:hypothetical protein
MQFLAVAFVIVAIHSRVQRECKDDVIRVVF